MDQHQFSFPNVSSYMTNPAALFSVGYGLYIVTTRENGKDSGLVVNTVSQVSNDPTVLAVGINRANFSAEVISRTKKLNVNVLTESAPFSLFQRFGFQSGRTADKMKDLIYGRSENNLPVLREYTSAFFSLSVQKEIILPTHILFLCTIEESEVFSKENAMTYAFYHASVKPKKKAENKKGYVCKICGYVHEAEMLPADFICPICKHPASDFEKLS
ncbi:MAG: flavin reductase [Clostridia bacterium]|nr:flavin reductase [Clostridia bacterium]